MKQTIDVWVHFDIFNVPQLKDESLIVSAIKKKVHKNEFRYCKRNYWSRTGDITGNFIYVMLHMDKTICVMQQLQQLLYKSMLIVIKSIDCTNSKVYILIYHCENYWRCYRGKKMRVVLAGGFSFSFSWVKIRFVLDRYVDKKETRAVASECII